MSAGGCDSGGKHAAAGSGRTYGRRPTPPLGPVHCHGSRQEGSRGWGSTGDTELGQEGDAQLGRAVLLPAEGPGLRGEGGKGADQPEHLERQRSTQHQHAGVGRGAQGGRGGGERRQGHGPGSQGFTARGYGGSSDQWRQHTVDRWSVQTSASTPAPAAYYGSTKSNRDQTAKRGGGGESDDGEPPGCCGFCGEALTGRRRRYRLGSQDTGELPDIFATT